MALVKTVTKVMPDANNVNFHLKLTDDSAVVIDKTYSDGYDPAAGPSAENKANIQVKMQKDIDTYKTKKAVFDLPGYDTAATNIENGLVL